MRSLVRIYLALGLSLLVLLTGQGMASTRGMNAAVGHMVICTGTGPVAVMVDEDGQPTQAPAFCPDYAMSLLGAVLPDVVAVQPLGRQALPAPVAARTALVSHMPLCALARGPPVTV